MNDQIENHRVHHITWRTARAWQGKASFAVIELLPAHRSTVKKAYLILDALSGSISIKKEKPDSLKPTGAFAEIFRKHLPHGIITGHLTDHDFEWIEIKSEGKRLFLGLEKKPHPVIHLIISDTSIVRLSSQGTFTKSIPFARKAPDTLPIAQLSLEIDKEEGAKSDTVSPEFRELLPRLKRRAKTIEKSLKKAFLKCPSEDEIKLLEVEIEILKSHLHEILPGANQLEVEIAVSNDLLAATINFQKELNFWQKIPVKLLKGIERSPLSSTKISIEIDPSLTPGGNLDKFYKELKRKKKSYELGKQQLEQIKEELEEISKTIQAIREGKTSAFNLSSILKRFGITSEKQKNLQSSTASPLRSDKKENNFREFIGYNQAIFRVSRSSAEGDRLCKSARGNDTWFHVLQGKGSHVILVSKSIKDRPPDPRQLRQGAILALHFSSIRAECGGEVQVSTRNQIRKPKGLPAGLWLVDRAESLYIRYENDELRSILGSSSEP